MDSKLLKVLKAQRTRLLNKKCETTEDFENIQERLHIIETQIMLIENDKHIPHID